MDVGTAETLLINLPYALISECASFLEMHEYFIFARCTRKTYLALYQQPKLSHSPFKMALASQDSKILHSFQYNIFRNCRNIEINTAVFTDTIPFQSQCIWQNNNNIKRLALSQSSQLGLFPLRGGINFRSIKKLHLRYLNYPTHFQINYAQNAQSFINTFKYFQSLQTLELAHITLKNASSPPIMTNPFNALATNIKNYLCNIKHLKL